MTAIQVKPLPQFLADVQVEMEAHADAYGLDFFPTIFEVVDVDQLNAIAAYGGFPTRYPHWRFGMEYRATRQRLCLWTAKNLRTGHQQRPLLRLPAEQQLDYRPSHGDRPRLRPLRLLQEQLLVQPDQSQND